MTEDLAELNHAAKRALSARDYSSAHAILGQLVGRDRNNIAAWLNLAGVQRQLGNASGAFESLREVLRIDPRNFPALLMSATLLERAGSLKQAAAMYGIALAQAPPDDKLDTATLQAVNHARAVHTKHTTDLNAYIRDHLASTQSQYTSAARRRIDSFIATTLRLSKRYQQDPTHYYYPGLPSIEFYEREDFPWLNDLETATEAIQRELATIMREDEKEFAPYIHYDDHQPLDQWRELNHSPRWSAFHFFEQGKPVDARCRRAPVTMQAIARLPQPQVPLRSPAAFFSVLQPRTRIPPHTGIANFRLVVHLPLILPPHCGFRVGNETREWRVGQAWVFDDTIEHEAWNDCDQTRVILICDIWNPRLSEEERTAIAQVIAATDAFNDEHPTSNV